MTHSVALRKTMPRLINTPLILLLMWCSDAHALVLNVYILTGQSNSLGTTSLEGAASGPGTDSADAVTSFFWSNVDASNTTYPPNLYGSSASTISTLSIQQGDGTDNPAFWGPEFGFARTLAAAGQANVMVIKVSRGGGGNTYWDKAAFDGNPSAGHMWGQLRDTVRASLTAAQNAGYQVKVNGLLYLQGESNSSTEAALADVRLSNLAANIRQDINTNFGNAASNMKIVVGEIASSWSTASRITTTNLQRSLADGRSDVSFIQTHDQPLKSDGIHFGKDAKLLIGQRFADAMLDLQSRPASVLARYQADLAAPTPVSHPSTQGWTETSTATSGATPNVTLAGVIEDGTRGWRIVDNSETYNPGYKQPLVGSDYQAMFDRGWTFRARVKVASGGGMALWSVTAANAPTGWDIGAGVGNLNGFKVDRVNGDQLQIQLWGDVSVPSVNLGVGSANDFHMLELVGKAGSNKFDFFVDGQLRGTSTISSGAGLVGFENVVMFNASTGNSEGSVMWNEVSIISIPEPPSIFLLLIGFSMCWLTFRKIKQYLNHNT